MDKVQVIISLIIVWIVCFGMSEEAGVAVMMIFIIAFGVAVTIKWIQFRRERDTPIPRPPIYDDDLLGEDEDVVIDAGVVGTRHFSPSSYGTSFGIRSTRDGSQASQSALEEGNRVLREFRLLVQAVLADDLLVREELVILEGYLAGSRRWLNAELQQVHSYLVLALSDDVHWETLTDKLYDFIERTRPKVEESVSAVVEGGLTGASALAVDFAESLEVGGRYFLRYRDAKGEESERLVDVRSFAVNRWGYKVVKCYCHQARGIRSFRVDRILGVWRG